MNHGSGSRYRNPKELGKKTYKGGIGEIDVKRPGELDASNVAKRKS